MSDMRLYQHRDIWYVTFPGGKRRSLGTKDKRVAKKLFRDIEVELIKGNLLQLEKTSCPTISRLKNLYVSDPDRKDLSPDSIRADELALNSLSDVIGDITINRVEKNHISKFKQVLSTRDVRPVSVNTYLRRIRAALNWAKEQGHITGDPPKIKMIKTGESLPRVIDNDEVDRILHCAKETKPEMHRIIQFALFTGCRRKEIVSARYEHIKGGSILITGKGNRQRIVPLVAGALEVIEKQDFGKIFSYENVSTVTNYYRQITRTVGVQSRFHDLRHTAATRMLTVGVPIEVIQKILGHAELRTTQIYSKVVQDRLKTEMEKLNYE